MSINLITAKKDLLTAFNMERKAQDIYTEVWNALSEEQRSNIQKTLIDIIFVGDEKAFKEISDQYKLNKEKLSPPILKDIQCFHRTAMAFSRRAKKEIDSMETLIETIVSGIKLETNTGGADETNTVSSKDKETTDKLPRITKPVKEINPEKLIEAAIKLVIRDDVKVLLQQALIQLKLSLTISGNVNNCLHNNIQATDFSEVTGSSFEELDKEKEVILNADQPWW